MSAAEGAIDRGEELPGSFAHRAPLWQMQGSVRVKLDEPGMEAAIKATSVYCASIAPELATRRLACEAFLVRLLRSRLRLVRTEMLSRKLRGLTDEERLRYSVKERPVAYSQIYFLPAETTYVKDGLEILSRRVEGGLGEAERRLLLRCTVLGQAVQAGKRAHSELVRALNSQRKTNVGQTPKVGNRGQKSTVVDSAVLRIRFREWTVRAGVFATISYMRHKTSPLFWERAYRLLERMIRLQRNVIVSQVRHGRPGHRLRDGGVVLRGLGIEPNKHAYITPWFNIEELWVLREGLELKEGERALNPTERVLLLKAKLLEGARYGANGRHLAWRLGGLTKRKRYRASARW